MATRIIMLGLNNKKILTKEIKKLKQMKTLHYILNAKTDQSFDTMEMKFYPNNWQPEMEEDKDYLQRLIDQDPEKFENCFIETVTF